MLLMRLPLVSLSDYTAESNTTTNMKQHRETQTRINDNTENPDG